MKRCKVHIYLFDGSLSITSYIPFGFEGDGDFTDEEYNKLRDAVIELNGSGMSITEFNEGEFIKGVLG